MGKRRCNGQAEENGKDVDMEKKKRRKKSARDSPKPAQSDAALVDGTDASASAQVPVLSCRGLRSANVALDRDLWLWYSTANKKPGGTKVSKRLVQARAKWAFHRAGITDFKASDGWYRRWISRWRRFSSDQPGFPTPQPRQWKTASQKKLKHSSLVEGQPVSSLQILQEVASRELSQVISGRGKPGRTSDSAERYHDLVEDVIRKEEQRFNSAAKVPIGDVANSHSSVMNSQTVIPESVLDLNTVSIAVTNPKFVSGSAMDVEYPAIGEERTVLKSVPGCRKDERDLSDLEPKCDAVSGPQICTPERQAMTATEFVVDRSKHAMEPTNSDTVCDTLDLVVGHCVLRVSESASEGSRSRTGQTGYKLASDLDYETRDPVVDERNVTALDFVSGNKKPCVELTNSEIQSIGNNITNGIIAKYSDPVSSSKGLVLELSSSDLESNLVHSSRDFVVNESSEVGSKENEHVMGLTIARNNSFGIDQDSIGDEQASMMSESAPSVQKCRSRAPSAGNSPETITVSVSDENEHVTELTIPSTSFIIQKEIDRLLTGTNVDLVPEVNASPLGFSADRSECRPVLDNPKSVETNLLNLYDIFHSPTSDSLDSMLYYTAMNGMMSHHHHHHHHSLSTDSSTVPDPNLANMLDVPFHMSLAQANNKNAFLSTGQLCNERLKDLFSTNHSGKGNLLDSLLSDGSGSVMHMSSAAENENSVSTLSSESSQDFIESVFRDVSLSDSSKSEVRFSQSASKTAPAVSGTGADPPCAGASSETASAAWIDPPDATDAADACKNGVRKGAASSVGSKFQPCKNGKRYLPHFKDKVLSYVANHTFKETAKKFRVHQESITSWKTDKARRKLTSRRSSKGSKKGVVPAAEPVDEQFLAWLRRSRERRHKLTGAEVRDRARELMTQGAGRGEACWFRLWVSRFDEKAYEEGMEDVPRSGEEQRHIHYPPAFRTEVAAFADCYSQIQTSQIFCVSRKRVFEWLKAFRDNADKGAAEKSSESCANRQGSRRTVTDVDVDQQIWSWYQEQLSTGSKPRGEEVRTKGVSLYRERGHVGIQCSYSWYKRWCDRFGVVLRYDGDDALLAWTLAQLDRNRALTHHDLQERARELWQRRSPHFKASAGWAIRFCKRHPKLLQQAPAVHTPLPPALLASVDEFRASVQRMVRDRLLPPGAVGNMDELHLNFSAPLSGGSKRHLLLRKSGMQNCHATIVLACLADGNMLPPTVILKGTQEILPTSSDLPVLHQEDGQMDAACMEQWLKLVWFKQVAGPSLLVADCFDPHSAPSLAEEFSSRQSAVAIIPGGCTSKLQPLDVSIKRNFQLLIEKQWMKLNSCSANSWSSSCSFHVPSPNELLDWVRNAHLHVQTTKQETIRRSFLITGLMVAANHSEDHFIENISMMPTDEDHK